MAGRYRTPMSTEYFDQLWHRRAILSAMAALAVAPAIPVDAGARIMTDPFALGVASGDPSQDGFVIWTRLVGPGQEPLDAAAVALRYEVAGDASFRRIFRAGSAVAHPERAHAVHVEIEGLPPGRRYWYRFHALGATSPAGRAATVPRTADRLRLAVTSCQHWEQAQFGVYRDIVAADPDLIVQLGDYIYEQSYPDQPKVRLFGAAEPKDLDGYRRRHALYKSDPELQAAHRAAPWIVTWDDHEVLNDYANLANREGLPPELFGRRRAAAYRAYFEHMPIRPSLWSNGNAPHLYRALDWADLVSMSVLDTRQYRTAPPCAAPNMARNVRLHGCAEVDRPDRSMLGGAQEQWLTARLAGEYRPWTLIAQQIFFAPLYLDGARSETFSDQWDAYAAARARLLDRLAGPSIQNPFVLSGDVHSFWVNELRRADREAAIGAEIVTSALGAASPPAGRFGDVHANNPHVRHSDVDHAGYVLIDLDRRQMQADMRAIADRASVDSPVRSARCFVSERGSRRISLA
ncbi:alkaline phosphatase D family protein [Sphingomonas oleivorans]|nr:alkaline phosphatase D family protein [Sphingomonas oleivorans]